MKKLKLYIAIVLLLMAALPYSMQAQNYNTAAGLRLGYPLSVSVKHFITSSSALEAYVGTRGYSGFRWTNISGAYQIHKDLEGVDGLQYYFGAGASVYFWSFEYFETYATTTFGLQGYAGLEYTFDGTPISVTVDWVPTVFFSGYYSGFGAGYGSLGARYTFAR